MYNDPWRRCKFRPFLEMGFAWVCKIGRVVMRANANNGTRGIRHVDVNIAIFHNFTG